MTVSKIEKLGLVKRIEELISAGVTTSQAISEALKKEGKNISQPSVSRYLKTLRDTRLDETKKILQDHVQKTVPADLTAIETMEAQCLRWAEEDNQAFAHRIAAKNIDENLNKWSALIRDIEQHPITDAAAKERQKTLREIMEQCLLFIADDLALQRSRIAAMKMARDFIDTKLKYAGLIDSEQEGNVFIVGKEDRLEQDQETGRFIVHKGGRNGA